MSSASRLPFLAPSQCPRHSPASFIGGSVEEDERRFFVGGEAAREETPHPARDGKAARLESEPCATLNSGCCAMARERNVAQDPLSGPAAFPAGWFPSAPHNGKPVFRHIAWRPATPHRCADRNTTKLKSRRAGERALRYQISTKMERRGPTKQVCNAIP